jgi:uncharacterized protein
MKPADTATDCVVYRCKRQDEMYLYLRSDLRSDQVPEALRQRTGRLTEVMRLQLDPARRLARVDVLHVIAQLRTQGWFLQLPPQGQVQAWLNDAD